MALDASQGGRPLGSRRQLPPQLIVGRRPLGGRGGGVLGGALGGPPRRAVPWGRGECRAPPNSWVCCPDVIRHTAPSHKRDICIAPRLAEFGAHNMDGSMKVAKPPRRWRSPNKGAKSEVKTYARGNNDAPSISKYGALVRPDAQTVAKCAPLVHPLTGHRWGMGQKSCPTR